MSTFTVNTHHAYLNNDIIIKTDGQISIEDTITGQKYEFKNELKTHLSAGYHILKSDNHEEEIFIEDAIKFGGSRLRNAFVFDNTPWIFVTTKDRLYITNIETHEEKIEYNITPNEIMSLPSYRYKSPNEYFLLKTHEDYAIYNVLIGKIVIQFANYIFSNGHLVIFKQEDGIEVYDFCIGKTIVHFEGQYSFGKKFYYVKDNLLHGLNLGTSYINTISYVGNVNDCDMLLGNHLLRLNNDYLYKKSYTYFSLGDGESEKSMLKTKLTSPYYIESWDGETTSHFSLAKENFNKFDEEFHKIRLSFPNIYSMCLGMRVNDVRYLWKSGKQLITFHGEIVAYPDMKFAIPFVVEGVEGEPIDFAKYAIEIPNNVKEEATSETSHISYSLDKSEREIGKSTSGYLLVTQDGDDIFLRDLQKDEKRRILHKTFDTSNYVNAYFTSDGKSVFLRVNNSEAQLYGFDNITTEPFEVDGFTLSKNDGYNGYKPEVLLSSGRKPVWRDPVTLNFIAEKDMSSHVYKSPNGEYLADIQMKTIDYNRLTKSEMSLNEVNELKSKYNWTSDTSEEEKKAL